MVSSSGSIVSDDDGGGDYWTERADSVLDSVSSLYSELIIIFSL